MSTIAAIATAMGVGGIGIIRISGEDTFEIIDKIFIPKKKDDKIKGYQMKYGTIIVPQTGEIVDEVLVSFFKSPNSYTTEDVCEINCHGGIITIQKILEICLENGAELAMPGEFTQRAFLNGRIDLSQAEAVIDIINAKSEKENKASLKQLEGNLSKKIKKIRDKIMNQMVDIEASIDYPEYDIEEVQKENLYNTMEEIVKELKNLEKSFEQGKMVKEGIKVAIIGKPNAGKSSLLNSFLGEERAIVTDKEGTTRDSIEEVITVEGIPLKIIDTAGLRRTEEVVEKIGIERAKKIAKEADLIIVIFDITKNADEEDTEILEQVKEKNSIIILNKTDLQKQNKELEEKIEKVNKKVFKISAKEDIGVDLIKEEIVKMFQINEIDLESSDSIIITNIRHKKEISESIKRADKLIEEINNNIPIDILAIEIREILQNLGNITGEAVSEEIINSIFSKFCLGK